MNELKIFDIPYDVYNNDKDRDRINSHTKLVKQFIKKSPPIIIKSTTLKEKKKQFLIEKIIELHTEKKFVLKDKSEVEINFALNSELSNFRQNKQRQKYISATTEDYPEIKDDSFSVIIFKMENNK